MYSFYINIQLTAKNNVIIPIFLSLSKNFVRYRVAIDFTEVMWGKHLFTHTGSFILMNAAMLICARGILNAFKEINEPEIRFLESKINSEGESRKRKSE